MLMSANAHARADSVAALLPTQTRETSEHRLAHSSPFGWSERALAGARATRVDDRGRLGETREDDVGRRGASAHHADPRRARDARDGVAVRGVGIASRVPSGHRQVLALPPRAHGAHGRGTARARHRGRAVPRASRARARRVRRHAHPLDRDRDRDRVRRRWRSRGVRARARRGLVGVRLRVERVFSPKSRDGRRVGRPGLASPLRASHAHGHQLRRRRGWRRAPQPPDVPSRRRRRAVPRPTPSLAPPRILLHHAPPFGRVRAASDSRARRRRRTGARGRRAGRRAPRARRVERRGRRRRSSRRSHATLRRGRAHVVAPRRLRRVRVPGWFARGPNPREARDGEARDAEDAVGSGRDAPS